ncbi:MAG: hypothetical protein A2845_03990 [Candidatus Lloydbacteria bacterium RIFCSPHIGHO2_01_FULL_49_22]|uniref:Uncharacterized protein n=1 Tax=Candidatus Lloydbacteria bacterium RIFCSPHIGHO2_01_FULL_49_22 TaxID=1798658 RepID=A0A1G2CX53_9BACT|nr:MAG: hypothetical protein A2845_03990 [Candidatus Lloydbacteria bacterium RIFCSPHIGHO2_01_FULL_49_22]OGZ09087.1 MAG: hypothetical protein A3C14_03825 [Candidatus Lloydbacteria bacterium RIFCSPHIGHO2_02_FULL_50_18]
MEKEILEQIKYQNSQLRDIFIFLLSREGYNDSEIRAIVGSVDNNKIRKISAGLKRIKKLKK